MATAAFNLVEKYAPFIAEQLVTVNATTAQNQLYGDVNLGGLNWLERTWASYYIAIGNPVLATGLMSFVLHEVCHYPLCFVELRRGGLPLERYSVDKESRSQSGKLELLGVAIAGISRLSPYQCLRTILTFRSSTLAALSLGC